MSERENDDSQNPYRSPAAVDDEGEIEACRRRRGARDLIQIGLVWGLAYGAASGAAITVGLEAVRVCVWGAEGRESLPDIDGFGLWLSGFVAVAICGAALGGMSGAVLGPVQGWRTAFGPSAGRVGLIRSAAFYWAIVSMVWCVLIYATMLSAMPQRWLLHLALVLAPLVAGFAGATMASKLARAAAG
jgi:hypothetical protein